MASIIRKIISSAKAPAPIGPYNQGILVDKTLYLSGQIGMDKNGTVATGIEAQTRLALENLGHVLNASGASYNNVVKTTVLLADMNTFATVNAIYAEYFKGVFPARAAYQVSVLPKNALIEIEAIAVVGEITESKL